MLDRPHPIIRRASRADIPEISSLTAEALETFRGIVPDNLLDLYLIHSCDIAARWDGGDVLVIEADGRIAGTVTYVDRKRKANDGLPEGWSTFRSLAVHPNAQGRGLGETLVHHCIDAAREGGASVLGLYTGAFMTAARRIYKRAGFVRCPGYDFFASSFFDFDPSEGDVLVAAYRLNL